MEINSTFRRSHKPQTWERWRDSVPDRFRFAVKGPSTTTHGGSLDPAPLPAFFTEIATLNESLGPVLFQFPPKQAFDRSSAVAFFQRVRDLFDGDVVCEPRHAEWFTEVAEKVLEKFRVARVSADPSWTIDRARTHGGFSGLRYYRLHGSPRTYYSEYSGEFLKSLAAELRQSNVPTWCIFDNTASGAAFGNALSLQRLLRTL